MSFLSSVILDLAKVLLSLVYFSLRISHSFEPCWLDTKNHGWYCEIEVSVLGHFFWL